MKKHRNKKPEALWLSVSPHLKGFDQRLLVQLAKTATVRRWEYCQTVDEPCCLESVIASLHEYIQSRAASGKRPIHLLGHGVSGAVGLLYARRYPQYVASLTLLSVGPQPAVNWQAHYYALRQLLPCRREMILMQMARLLFGAEPARFAKALATLLARDLDSNLTLHSLAHSSEIPSGNAAVPLLVCNGEADIVTNRQSISWEECMKQGGHEAAPVENRLWNCPDGNYFFHFHYSEATARTIAGYWEYLHQCESRFSRSAREVGVEASIENLIIFLPSSTI